MKNTIHKIFKCPNCISKNKRGNLKILKNYYICTSCEEFYPFYKGFPVLLTKEGDFYHLKKALSPAKYRVFRYNEN